MTEAHPSLREQANAVECLYLSQKGWLEQAEMADAKYYAQTRTSVVSTRLHIRPLEAAVETLKRLAMAEELDRLPCVPPPGVVPL